MTYVEFNYKNYRGEISGRRINVIKLYFDGSPEYGYGPGWFILGFDLDKKAQRVFHLDHVIEPREIILAAAPSKP